MEVTAPPADHVSPFIRRSSATVSVRAARCGRGQGQGAAMETYFLEATPDACGLSDRGFSGAGTGESVFADQPGHSAADLLAIRVSTARHFRHRARPANRHTVAMTDRQLRPFVPDVLRPLGPGHGRASHDGSHQNRYWVGPARPVNALSAASTPVQHAEDPPASRRSGPAIGSFIDHQTRQPRARFDQTGWTAAAALPVHPALPQHNRPIVPAPAGY